MESKLFIAKLVMKNGRLAFKKATDLSLFNMLARQLKEGQSVEQMISFGLEDGTLSQIAKVHACIRDIAKETGDTFTATKVSIKKQCGLIAMGGDVKSFGDCSFSELSDCIHHCVEIGTFLGIDLK